MVAATGELSYNEEGDIVYPEGGEVHVRSPTVILTGMEKEE